MSSPVRMERIGGRWSPVRCGCGALVTTSSPCRWCCPACHPAGGHQ